MKNDKQSNKIKLVKILEILRQDSDGDNYIDCPTIIKKLAEQGINCDRRTLYSDISVLNSFGYEVLVEKSPGRPNKYCIVDRSFDVPELRILMDAVQAASFVTPTKTVKLLDKIADLGGSHRAELLKKNIVRFNTAKHTNEQVFYTIDTIEEAMLENKQIGFYYFSYNAKKEKVYKKDKKRYIVNPHAMVFDNDNYYFIGYDGNHENMTHYRIDRMDNVEIEQTQIKLFEWVKEFDLTRHKMQVFNMYSGEPKKVTLCFDNSIIDSVLDKFGESVHLIADGDNRVKMQAIVQISPQFFAWVCAFKEKMKVVEPVEVVDEIREYIRTLQEMYRG